MPNFKDIPLMTIAKYKVDIFWDFLEEWLEKEEVDMNPDFQRGYVWTQQQKEQYVEWILRNGESGKDLYFNHPGWFKSWEGQMVIVDGKQRIEAVLGFIHNEVKAYGYYRKEYRDKWSMIQCCFHIHVADLKTREEVLKWYLDMNTGGTYHTDAEIDKVKKLIEACHV